MTDNNTKSDLEEINSLIVRCYSSLARFASHLIWRTKMRDIEPEDLINMTIVRILTKKHTFKKGTNFSSWAIAVMHNELTSYIIAQRRQMRQPEGGLVIETEAHAIPAVDDPSIGLVMRDFHQEFAKLSPTTQKLILMSYDGILWTDIAKIEQLPIGTVRSRISRGKHRLRAADVMP